MISALLRYSHCLGSLTLSTHISYWYGLVFSKLSRRKEITDHLWEGEGNQCPFCASWNCTAFSQSISQDGPFCTLPIWALRALTRDASLDPLKDRSHSENAFSFHTELKKKKKNSRFFSKWSQIFVLVSGFLPIYTVWLSLSSKHRI